ncbi:MAG: succinyl-CoA synthetase subunit beta, partial [candidate division Zixibacteria bacterium]|nr:succinyl-CoA synthetase subunit beta [candidate division Zixibacteria bacterium]
RLGLRIDDIHHNYEDTDRWTGRIAVVPGPNHLRIGLEQVRKGPVGRETDMSAIRRIILFAHKPQQPVTLYLDRIWLE